MPENADASKGLAVGLKIKELVVSLSDELSVTIDLTNKTDSVVALDGRFAWSAGANLGLAVRDSRGDKPILPSFLGDVALPPPRSQEVFVSLGPEESLSIVRSVSLRDLSISTPGRYTLRATYRSPIGAGGGFGLPVWPSELGYSLSNTVTIDVRK